MHTLAPQDEEVVMSKELHKVKLEGRLADMSLAKTHQANDVKLFKSPNGFITVAPMKPTESGTERILLSNRRGQVQLVKHPSMNYYHGKMGEIKIQVTLKKIVGEFRYWE
jgi:hypothetical protein